jgi:ligand-binding sensor domain-containing protein/two-component sensor histidine kinase
MYKIVSLLVFFAHSYSISFCQQQMGAYMAYGAEAKYLNSQNFVVHQSPKGYLWIGTQNGLVRFDGKQYKNYFADYTNLNSPTDNSIVDIVEDKNGELWFCGFTNGLTKFNERTNQFKKYRQPTIDNFQFYGINDGHKDNEGNLWFATSGRGLAKYIYEKDSFELFFPEPEKCRDGSKRGENYVTGICEDKNNPAILWITTFVGFYSFNKENKLFTYYPSGIKVSYASDINFMSCDADSKGNIWMGTYNEGLVCFNSITKKFVQENRKTFPRIIGNVKVISDSILFAAGLSNGLYQYNLITGAYNNITPPRNPADPTSKNTSIHKISLTKDAGIFIGGNNYIYQLHPSFTRLKKNITYEQLNSTDFVELNNIIWDNSRKQYWLTTSYGKGLYTLKEKDVIARRITVNETPTNQYKIYTSLIKDAKNNIWVLNYFSGIYLWNDVKNSFEKPSLATIPLPDSIIKNIKSLQTDSIGNIWLLSGNNFVYYNVLQHTHSIYPIIWDTNYKGAKKYSPALIRIDPRGNPWLLTQNGLFVCDVKKKKVTHVITKPTSLSSLPSNAIGGGVFNRYKNFWLTSGNNLFVYDWQNDSVLSRHTIYNGLPSMYVSDVNSDYSGRIWVSTLSGLGLFDPLKKIWRTYNRFDGLEKDYLDGAVFITENNKIAIDQNLGFLLKDINEIGSSTTAPLLRFTSININDKKYIDSIAPEYCVGLNLSYNQNNITLEFAAMDWLYPFKTNYTIKIDGIQSSKTFNTITENKINLTSLAPGEYTVHVKAISGSGVWSNEIILPITVNKPFWQRAWFIILCISLVVALLYTLYKYRINQLEKVQAMRNNISRNLHDDIGSSLSNINILTELVKRNHSNPIKSDEYLNKMSEDIQHISESLSDIVWNINPKYDDLENLFIRMKRYAADMMDGKNINYELVFPEKPNDSFLEMEKRKDLYFIFKEAINNLVKYSNAKHAEVKLTITKQVLELLIKDDGIGFNSKELQEGNGLQNMRHRANLINAHLQITSAPTKGTSILLQMKIT